jgi:hypothetical protein
MRLVGLAADLPGGQEANIAPASHLDQLQETSMDQQLIPQPEPQPEKPKVERINGQDIPIMTVEQVARGAFGKSADEALTLQLVTLVVAKFVTAWGKLYRLAWAYKGRRCLAEENPAEYRTRRRAVIAGITLAAQTKAHFFEGSQ